MRLSMLLQRCHNGQTEWESLLNDSLPRGAFFTSLRPLSVQRHRATATCCIPSRIPALHMHCYLADYHASIQSLSRESETNVSLTREQEPPPMRGILSIRCLGAGWLCGFGPPVMADPRARSCSNMCEVGGLCRQAQHNFTVLHQLLACAHRVAAR